MTGKLQDANASHKVLVSPEVLPYTVTAHLISRLFLYEGVYVLHKRVPYADV